MNVEAQYIYSSMPGKCPLLDQDAYFNMMTRSTYGKYQATYVNLHNVHAKGRFKILYAGKLFDIITL